MGNYLRIFMNKLDTVDVSDISDSKDNHHRDPSSTEKSIKIFKSNRLIHLFDIEILE
jgi:hypothetical protein